MFFIAFLQVSLVFSVSTLQSTSVNIQSTYSQHTVNIMRFSLLLLSKS
jgi:hypothetical protein